MNEENDIQQEEISDAALQLAQAFQELMEECAPDFPKEVSEQIVRLSNQISQIENKQQQSLYNFESIRQLLENTVSANSLLEKAGETNLLLGKQHYEEHIIEPMLRSLFPVFDIIADSRKHHGYCSCNAMSLMDSIYSQLLQFLANYGVEIFEHTTADSYDREIMKPIKWETTSQEHLENSIAQSLQAGFRLGQTRILRMETVSLYKHQPSKTNTNILIERIEK
ncbi:MAG TPA: nucleotide exchange factor GrpE [Phycisphaerales bacterium]|nr:nucleotide exchange factor GrpE [Phycisphaerales bacterium]